MWRNDFPALGHSVHGKRLAFLDTAASAQKPQVVIDALASALSGPYANIHRGLYFNSQETTTAFEAVRGKVARFFGAASENEIIFTRNTTEAINLLASTLGSTFKAGDEIVLTVMEHHANLVPWQMLREKTGVVLKYIPLLADGGLDVEKLPSLITHRTKLVAFTHISNALGVINPAQTIVQQVKALNPETLVLVDGSQSAVHGAVNVQELGCDFFVCTAHKLYGPNGVGVLYGREALLNTLPPYQGGGDMIETVSLNGSTFKHAPHRFEAGTPPIAEVIAFGTALDYISALGWPAITAHETKLKQKLDDALSSIEGLTIFAVAKPRAGIASFVLQGTHTADVAMVLDQCGVAVRTGHHCCMPLMQALGVEGTIRASLGLYSDAADIDQLAEALLKAKRMLV